MQNKPEELSQYENFGISYDNITRRKSKQVSEALSVLMEENPCPEPAMVKVPPLLKSKHSMEGEEEDNIYIAL